MKRQLARKAKKLVSRISGDSNFYVIARPN
jgi:hypothetical protein